MNRMQKLTKGVLSLVKFLTYVFDDGLEDTPWMSLAYVLDDEDMPWMSLDDIPMDTYFT